MKQKRGKAAWAIRLAGVFLVGVAGTSFASDAGLERIRVDGEGSGFVLAESGTPFALWGVNYDRDFTLRLLEEYWIDEWDVVVEHFGQMRELGANAVRIHLQLEAFMTDPETPNRESLERLAKLVALAGDIGLYLNITGLGCYHKDAVPDWYDAMDETERWKVLGSGCQDLRGKSSRILLQPHERAGYYRR